MQATSRPHALLDRVTREHHGYLRGYARRLCRTPADADDLLQEALLAALGRPSPLATVDDARAWLTAVIRRRFVDTCRRRATRRRLQPQVQVAFDHAQAPEPPPPWWLDLDTEAVRAHLDALPAELARPFAMFTLERASYRAIADRLGIPVATVGTRILRARRRLRARLTDRADLSPGR